MTEKKMILLVSNGFYPEISPRSFRATELAKEFYRQGHDVTVITKYRNHDYTDFLKEFPISFKMLNKPVFPKIPEFKRKPFSIISRRISRLLTLLFEYPGIEEIFQIKKKLKHEKGYDLLISFAVPYMAHSGVAWARSSIHQIAKTWVADCGDPFMGNVLDTFKKPFYFGYLEKWFFRKADFITVPIESAKEGYYAEFYPKIIVIPQGFDFDLNIKAAEQPKNDVPTFAYAGSFLPGARDPRPLLKYLCNLDTPFRFLVYTNTPEMLNDYKTSLKEKLIISGYIPRAELMSILAKMDFVINFDNNTARNAPSKLIDYVIVNRPILNITKNFNSDDVKTFLNKDYSRKMKLPKPEYYHIKNVSQLFLNLLKD